MVDSPCVQCVHLIGAGSDAAPHAGLKIMNFRGGRRANELEDLAEFYRCDACKIILVRDLNEATGKAQWDWI